MINFRIYFFANLFFGVKYTHIYKINKFHKITKKVNTTENLFFQALKFIKYSLFQRMKNPVLNRVQQG